MKIVWFTFMIYWPFLVLPFIVVSALRKKLFRWRRGRHVQTLIERAYCEKHGYSHWAM